MDMDLIICLELDEVADDKIAWLQNDFKITNISIDDENIIRAKIVIHGVDDIQQLGYLLDDDIVIAGTDMDLITHRYALKQMGW